MSLTSLIKGNTEYDRIFQDFLRSVIPKKNQFITNTGEKAFSKYNSLVPYNLSNPYISDVIGIAFDYLARFIIASKSSKTKGALEDTVASHIFTSGLIKNEKDELILKEYYSIAIEGIRQFIYNEKSDMKKIVPFSCFLARLELSKRSLWKPLEGFGSYVKDEKTEILNEVCKLGDTFTNVFINSNIITHKSEVVYNPHFGELSKRLGGADGDIYADGVLYDLKTTKHIGYKWRDVCQICGYYFLYLLGNVVSDTESDLTGYKITKIALYKARYGIIESYEVNQWSLHELEEIIWDFYNILFKDVDFEDRIQSEQNILKSVQYKLILAMEHKKDKEIMLKIQNENEKRIEMYKRWKRVDRKLIRRVLQEIYE